MRRSPVFTPSSIPSSAPLRRIIVRSGFRKGITLLRSRSLRNNSRNFENKWIHRIQLSLLHLVDQNYLLDFKILYSKIPLLIKIPFHFCLKLAVILHNNINSSIRLTVHNQYSNHTRQWVQTAHNNQADGI